MNDLTIILIACAFICLIVGVVYFAIMLQKTPEGGTLFDVGKSLNSAVERGPRYLPASKVIDAKTCQEEFGKNSFWDAVGDGKNGAGCYTCPSGTDVNFLGDVKINKCINPKKTIFDPARISGATFSRPGLGPAGLTVPETTKGFFLEDKIIWRCPSNTGRYPNHKVDGPHACVGECEKMYPAIPDYKRGKTELFDGAFVKRFENVSNPAYRQGTNESNDDFIKRISNGVATSTEKTPPPPNLAAAKFEVFKASCWSCPAGMNRVLLHTDASASNACIN